MNHLATWLPIVAALSPLVFAARPFLVEVVRAVGGLVRVAVVLLVSRQVLKGVEPKDRAAVLAALSQWVKEVMGKQPPR